jgi:chemotaxis protein MotB
MIPPRRHSTHNEGETDSWLMSYADMITLLMCFFIIFVSVSEPKNDKFSAITKGIAERFGAVDLSKPFRGTMQSIQGIIERRQVLRDMVVTGSNQGIELELSADKFYEKGQSELKEDALPILQEMVEAMKKSDFLNFQIQVEGHTDDVPISTPLYPSNWEFSAARASRMVRFLLENGLKPAQIQAIGMGDSTPKLSNIDSAGRAIPENQRINQRVVIRLIRL